MFIIQTLSGKPVKTKKYEKIKEARGLACDEEARNMKKILVFIMLHTTFLRRCLLLNVMGGFTRCHAKVKVKVSNIGAEVRVEMLKIGIGVVRKKNGRVAAYIYIFF